MDAYEYNEKYTLEFVNPKIAIDKNRNVKDMPYDNSMFEREALVLELLIKEGYLQIDKE